MANPQLENGYTKIANEILDYLCCFRIPGEVRLVVDCVIRKTYGYHKKEDVISNSQIIEMTKMKKGNVSRALSKAITHKIVIKSDNKLKLNKNYKEWIKFGVIKNDNKLKVIKSDTKVIKKATRVIKSDNKKLSKVRDTKYNKDTYTKDNIQKIADTPTTKEIFLSLQNKDDGYEKLVSYLVDKGINRELAENELKKFTNYWTELNHSRTKQRWQLEKTFEVKRRLATWFSNINKFNKKKKGITIANCN